METSARLARACAAAIRARGGRAFLVGGSVRDRLLGIPVKDHDLESYGLAPDALVETLRGLGRVDDVGRSFGVLKLTRDGATIDVGLPRRDSKVARGHRGFAVATDPHLTPAEACARRDFTVNAILEDPLDGTILDPCGGRRDLERRLLRHVSPAFPEDPLRVLRAAQFAARFAFAVDPATAALCREIDPGDLPPERVVEEVRKWLLLAARPSIGLHVLEETGALRLFPELAALRGVPQDGVWHPEGDVFLHTGLCLDRAAGARGRVPRPFAFMLAVLFHDLGKATTTRFFDGRMRAHRHDADGEALARRALERITAERALIDEVAALVRLHLRPGFLLAPGSASDAAVRRLALAADLRMLVPLADADSGGRVLPEDEAGGFETLLEHAARLRVKDEAPRPLLSGRHLIALGMAPGPRMGVVLRAVFEKQLDGFVETEAQALDEARRVLREADPSDAPDRRGARGSTDVLGPDRGGGG